MQEFLPAQSSSENALFDLKSRPNDFEEYNILGVRVRLFFDPSFHIVPAALKGFKTSPSEQSCDFFKVYLHQLNSLKVSRQLGDGVDADCHQQDFQGFELIHQRDFIAQKAGKTIDLAVVEDIEDGFFNFLRWLAPRELLKNQHFVLHSSCVIDSTGSATLCLGPSGAGKTTISSFAPAESVLGDDLNVIKLERDKLYASPCPLGQRIQNQQKFNQWFPVKSLFWLCQSKELYKESLPRSQAVLFLHASLANLFWRDLDSDTIASLQKSIERISLVCSVEKLYFPLDKNIWQKVGGL